MLKNFINKPVLASVVSIIILILGGIGIMSLPIEQYPDIAPPTIKVSTSYSGASAETVLNSVIIPLEEQINGVQDMTYMESSATNGGGASITIYFKQGANADMAAINVQNKVSQAAPLLPAEVVRNGVTVQKMQSSTIMMINLKSENDDYDDKFVQNYANINVIPNIKRIPGVGDASVFGPKTYAMRVWLKPDAMKAYKIIPAEVMAALQDQNIESAPGEIGANSDQTFQYPLKFIGKLKTVEEFENIIIRSYDAQILRLKDIANVELGVEGYSVFTESGGKPSVLIGVNQTAGSNAQEIIKQIKTNLEEASAGFPPGVTYEFLSDSSEFLDASINKVLKTLLEAFILVFLVVLVFLQNFKATLVPAIAVPVSIVGTFFFLLMFGFSINLLTLFALLLAIGIVVDDAIVVVEAVYAKLEAGEKNVKKAATTAINEIAPAIVSITLVMAAVFVPVSFIGGTSGIFFKQFGLTLAIAILLSAVNALTLSPMLCALFLKTHEEIEVTNKNFIRKFLYYFNITFNAITEKYRKALEFLARKKNRWIALAIIAIFGTMFFILNNKLPTGFVPQEDSGSLMGHIALAPGSSLEQTDSVVKKVVNIAKKLPHVETVSSMTGLSFTSGKGTSYGALFVKMQPWSERNITASDLVTMLKTGTDTIPNANFIFFGMPTLQGFGVSSGVEIQMIDKTGGDINKFYEVTTDFLNQIEKRPEILMAMTSFNPSFPQKQIEANIAKIKDAGLTLNQVMNTLQSYVGGAYVSNFNTYGKQFRVLLQAEPTYRANIENLHGLTIKTANGTMAPITEFISIKDVTGPQTLNRFNLFASMGVTLIPNYKDGYTSGDVLKLLKETQLPEGFGYDYAGMTREEANSNSQTALIFALCVLFVYLLLSALYESYIIPFAVLLSLPIGLAGVYIFIYLGMLGGAGISNNIYVQIALIMLIGLLAKNAILIVEYAIQRRQQGMTIVKAAIEGAVARLRPILMTSFAFIFGLLPLATAQGAGAIGNQSIGISAIGGMLVGTLIGVIVIPILFILFQTLHERLHKNKIDTELTEIIKTEA